MWWQRRLLIGSVFGLMLIGSPNAMGVILHLSLDGVAEAPDEIDVSPGDVLSMYVVSYSIEPGYKVELSVSSPVILTNVHAAPGAGDLASVTDLSGPSFWDPDLIIWTFALEAQDSGGEVLPGMHFAFDIEIAADAMPGTTRRLDVLSPSINGDSATFNIVPEPGTVALLSLGGLVAFRRRRSR